MIQYYRLPKELDVDFNTLYKLRSDEKSNIILFDKEQQEYREKQIFRSYMCYGNTPEFDSETKKSYMFLNKATEIPDTILTLLNYAKTVDSRFNQVVINFYKNDEYIEMHRDCTKFFVNKDAPILMLNFNESDDLYNIRSFNMISTETSEMCSVPLLNNHAYVITNNSTHRHYTGRGVEKRVSVTFRMIKEKEQA